MNYQFFFLTAFSLLLGATLNPPILEITDAYDSNINQLISSGGEAYLMFHASWCGACQRFKPYFQAFAEEMDDVSPSIQMFSIDNDLNPKLVARFQIAYLPTLYHVREGKVRNISDHRADLLEYVKNQKWNEIEAVSGFLAPYSVLGNVLAVVGTIGYSILGVVDKIHVKTKIPQHIVLCVMMALFFIVFYSFLFNFVLPKPKPVARRPSKPVTEQHTKSD